jgi:hypothetical protein
MEQWYIAAHRRLHVLALLAWFSSCALPASAQLPSFNGAEGYGGTFTGSAPAGGWFSNASVYHVTTTQDLIDPNTGKPAIGTLRGAFYDYTNPNSPKQNKSNQIVVFDVGGTFQLTQGSLDIKTVNNIYVAGQTAPSPVVVYGDTTQITKSNNTMTSNVILRYMTFRKGIGGGEDAITFAGGSGAGDTIATNMILDHVSASWSEDEDLSVANNNTNVTVQYSIIADSLTSGHAYGSLIRPQVDSNVSYHHNLYANNASRQPRLGTYNAATLTVDVRNNVVYNWRDRATYAGGSSEAEQEFVDVNYVGNYLVAGSGTVSNANKAFHVDKNVDVRAYQLGNFVDSDRLLNPGGAPNGSDLGWAAFQISTPVTDQTLTQMAAPFAMAPVTTQTATDAYNQLIGYVGNNWWSRDAIDSRIINNVLTNTGPPNGIAAAAPNAAELAGVTGAATTTRPAGWDTDQDGMPDEWEVAHGLNPNSGLDFKLDFDNDGYVNLQEYLDEIGAFPAPTPIVFNGSTSSRYAQITNWITDDGGITAGSNWQPTLYDEARINSGTVVVDAIGQHAGLLKIGSTDGSIAHLQINSGRLEVEEAILIGAHPTSQATLTLSGGELSTAYLSKLDSNDTFSFTGGVLHASNVDMDLVNNGGTLAPGHSVGQTNVEGELELASGILQIEIASDTSSDRMSIDGSIKLGGHLQVDLLGGFQPHSDDRWEIITADTFLEQFDSISAGYTVEQIGGSLFLKLSSPVLAGDYNDDGTVDAIDYTVWRDLMGTAGSLQNETASLGVIDGADFDAWKANFGTTGGSGSGSAVNSAVPEPATAVLMLIGVSLLPRRRRAA